MNAANVIPNAAKTHPASAASTNDSHAQPFARIAYLKRFSFSTGGNMRSEGTAAWAGRSEGPPLPKRAGNKWIIDVLM